MARLWCIEATALIVDFVAISADALRHRPCEQHVPICQFGDDGDFVLLGAESARSQAPVVDAFDAGDGGFDQGAFAVSMLSLPSNATVVGYL